MGISREGVQNEVGELMEKGVSSNSVGFETQVQKKAEGSRNRDSTSAGRAIE